MTKYVIVNIHPNDAFVEEMEVLAGMECTACYELHRSDLDSGYIGGMLKLQYPVPILQDDGTYESYQEIIALGFQLQTVEDNEKENGKIVTL